MRVLIACEESGIVRNEFALKGHDAWSCDLLPSSLPGNHIQGNVLSLLNDGWDMMIAHPPCTFLAYSGAIWFKQPGRMDKAHEAFDFFMALWAAPIPCIAIENPRGLPLKWFRQSDQKIQPCYFGDPMTKETHLWLKGLPPPDLYTNHHRPLCELDGIRSQKLTAALKDISGNC